MLIRKVAEEFCILTVIQIIMTIFKIQRQTWGHTNNELKIKVTQVYSGEADNFKPCCCDTWSSAVTHNLLVSYLTRQFVRSFQCKNVRCKCCLGRVFTRFWHTALACSVSFYLTEMSTQVWLHQITRLLGEDACQKPFLSYCATTYKAFLSYDTLEMHF